MTPGRRQTALDTIGVTLTGTPQGDYTIVGTATDVHGIQPGDRLLQIDGKDVTALPYHRVVAWLSGKPGETRMLRLIRGGEPVTVKATVRSVF